MSTENTERDIVCNNFGQVNCVKRRRIQDITDVKAADHIALERFGIYTHHALVESINVENNEVNVIHFSTGQIGDIFDLKSRGYMRVKRDAIKLESNGTITFSTFTVSVYVLLHTDHRPADEVLDTAKNELDNDHQYNVLQNNCEHFVMLCKVGETKSSQVGTLKNGIKRETLKSTIRYGVKTVAANQGSIVGAAGVGVKQALSGEAAKAALKESVKEGGKTATKDAVKNVAKEGMKNAASHGTKHVAKEGVKEITKEGTKHVVKEGAKETLKTGAKETSKNVVRGAAQGGTSIGASIGFVVEGAFATWDIWKAKEKMDAGEINNGEFEDAVYTRVHAAGGSVMGAVVGQTIIPIPVVGAVIGGAIGSLVGGRFAKWITED